jgi:hypothetical protein
MNRKNTGRNQHALIAAILLILGLLSVQLARGQFARLTTAAAANTVGQQRDHDYAALLRPFQMDTDRPGGDYTNFELRGAGDPEDCAFACGRDVRCKAFTYVRPGIQGPNARCWLKSSVPNAVAFPGVIAGVKRNETGGAGGPKYLGCFTDNNAPPDRPRDLAGLETNNTQMTTEQCVATCKGRGFAYAGTQYGSYCFCGNSYGRYGSQGRPCDQPCSGNGNQICGGAWANSVYSTSEGGAPPVTPQPTPVPPGPAKCDAIDGHWWGWSGDNSGASFYINPSNFPVNSTRIWAIGGMEVVPSDPNHADRWGEWECVGENQFKLVNRRGVIFNTLTLRGGRLYQADGRYACLNNANCQ